MGERRAGQAGPPFAAIEQDQLPDALVGRIGDAILLGELGPGDLLPSERELADQLGVNRTTVREGLARLQLLGLIDRRQGARHRVLDFRLTGSAELLPELARLGLHTSIAEGIGVVYEAIVTLAARRATKADAAAIRRAAAAVAAAVEAGSSERVIDTNRRFHHAVARATHSLALELLLNSFYRMVDTAFDRSGALRQHFATVVLDITRRGGPLPHLELAEAIAAKDEARARAVAAALVDEVPRRRRSGR